jgi:periplasmic protein TonB
MRSLLVPAKAKWVEHRGQMLSVTVNGGLLLCLAGGVRWSPHVAPARLPGTAIGMTTLTFYAPGSPKPLESDKARKSPLKQTPKPAAKHTASDPDPVRAQAAESEQGLGTSAQSGLGEGDITIALQTYFPYPKPDLSVLPHGTKGDVILNAVIDEHGKISELTLLKGLGSPVDDLVIATVQKWQYTPAMKNGVPVTSEQELHFHYERG